MLCSGAARQQEGQHVGVAVRGGRQRGSHARALALALALARLEDDVRARVGKARDFCQLAAARGLVEISAQLLPHALGVGLKERTEEVKFEYMYSKQW